MNLTKTTDKMAYRIGFRAFHKGMEISEAVGEALFIVADESGLEGDEMVTLTIEVIDSAQAGWWEAKTAAFRADYRV